MTTTEQDLRALAYLAKRLREETHGAAKWDDNGLWAILKKLEGHNLAITVERVTRHAADPEARTPAAMERPFIPDAQKPAARFPAKAGSDAECRTHPGQYAASCSGCASDQLTGETTPPRPHVKSEPGSDYHAARQALTTRKAHP